jgi:hypothetical protein
VQGIPEVSEEPGYTMSFEPGGGRFRESGAFGSENTDHLRETYYPGLPRNGGEVNEKLRSGPQSLARPQRVRQGESFDQLARAWSAGPGQFDGNPGRVLV